MPKAAHETITRRAILRGTPAAIAAAATISLPAIASAVATEGDARFVAWWERRAALINEGDRLNALDGPEDAGAAHYDEANLVDEQIMGTPAESAIGLAIKIRLLTDYETSSPDAEWPDASTAYEQGERYYLQWLRVSIFADAHRVAGMAAPTGRFYPGMEA